MINLKLDSYQSLKFLRLQFFIIIDLIRYILGKQLTELNIHFSEANTKLLLCVACLCPDDSFLGFDRHRLISLSRFFPQDFSTNQIEALDDQLETYILDMRSTDAFGKLKGIGAVAQKMEERERHEVYRLVYLLITLALIIPIDTATIERAFSAMNIIKNRLCNRMRGQ